MLRERSFVGMFAIGCGAGILCGSVATWVVVRDRSTQAALPLLQIEAPARHMEPAVLPETAQPIPDIDLEDLPPPTSSTNGNSAAAVRRAIDQLLPEASAEEREIWFQQFRDTPPGIVEDLLRMRRDIGTSTNDRWLPPAEVSPQPLRLSPSPDSPDTQGPSTDEETERTESQMARQHAWRLCAQNLLHAETPGYRRVIPLLTPRLSGDPASPEIVEVTGAGSRIDARPAALLPTGRPWDLGIEDAAGAFYFAVETPAGRAYTRYGGLELDDQSRVSIRFPAGRLPLTPEVKVPEMILRVEFAPNGDVRGFRDGAEKSELLGTIQLTEFRDPSQLVYSPNGWLSAPPSAGASISEPSDRWKLCGGCLEASNVDRDAERKFLEWIEAGEGLATGMPLSYSSMFNAVNGD